MERLLSRRGVGREGERGRGTLRAGVMHHEHTNIAIGMCSGAFSSRAFEFRSRYFFAISSRAFEHEDTNIAIGMCSCAFSSRAFEFRSRLFFAISSRAFDSRHRHFFVISPLFEFPPASAQIEI